MSSKFLKKLAVFGGFFAAAWITFRYLLPLFLPFLLGALVALAAEPAVSFGIKRLRLPRGAGVGIGVSLTLVLLISILSLIGTFAVKELSKLTDVLPKVENTAREGITQLQNWLTDLADSTPEGVRPMIHRSVTSLFGNDSRLMDEASGKALKVVTGVLGKIPDGALGLGVTLLSGFMISARLPQLKEKLNKLTAGKLQEKYLPALRRMRSVLGKWLVAQLKLTCVTFSIVLLGFFLLKIPYAPVWALGVSVVDALPVLGTGIILLPWALVSLLQGLHLQAIGLLVIYGAAAMTRTVLEPRLVGSQIGLDPLVTLLFLYVGYRFWGILGMILAPLLAAAVKSAAEGI